MLGEQMLELTDQRGVPAGGQVGVDPRLQRGQALLLEARDVRRRERLVGEIRKWRSPPEGERIAQDLRGTLGLVLA